MKRNFARRVVRRRLRVRLPQLQLRQCVRHRGSCRSSRPQLRQTRSKTPTRSALQMSEVQHTPQQDLPAEMSRPCSNGGGMHAFGKQFCRARDVDCFLCGRRSHNYVSF